MREVGEDVAVLGAYAEDFSETSKRKTCGEVANQRWQSDLAHDQAEREGEGDPDSFNQDMSPVKKFYIYSRGATL